MVLICVLPQVALWGKGKVCTNRTKFIVEDLQKKMAEIENEVDAREQALLGKVKL